jgi:hypothetical protein
MDVNKDMSGMAGGVNGAMNGGGLSGANLGAISTGLGTLGQATSTDDSKYNWGVGVQAQASPDEKRIMAGFTAKF